MRKIKKLIIGITPLLALIICCNIKAQHFTPVYSGNPYLPMNTIVSNANINAIVLEAGDEIALFDTTGGNEYCVGACVITPAFPGTPAIFNCAADDPLSPEIDGFINLHRIIVKLWDNSESLEVTSVARYFNAMLDTVFTQQGTCVIDSIAGESVLPYLVVQDVTITDGQTRCYHAYDSVLVAGESTTVEIQSGGEAIFIAGNKIVFKEGFSSSNGSYVHAFITTDSSFCSQYPFFGSPDNNEEIIEEDMFTFTQTDAGIKVYPNPSTNVFNILLEKDTLSSYFKYQVFNNIGRLIETGFIHAFELSIDLSKRPVGIYFVIVSNACRTHRASLIKVQN